MAAKKSIPRKSAAHADARPAPKRSRARQHCTERLSTVPAYGDAHLASCTQPAQDRADVIDRMNVGLSLVETIAVALREFEDQPTLGSICVTVEQAIAVLRHAHARAEHHLHRKSSKESSS